MRSLILSFVLLYVFVPVSQAIEMGDIHSDETLSGSIVDIGQMDTWYIQGLQGDRLLISARAISGLLHPCIVLYPPDGGRHEAIAYNGFLDHQLRMDGIYHIAIYDGDTGAGDDSLDDTGAYTMTVWNLQGSSGVPLQCDISLAGTITAHSDMNVYELQGLAGQRIILSAKVTSSAVAPLIALYPPDGSRLEAVAYNGLLDHQLRQDGTYRVVIYDGDTGAGDSSLDDTGDYIITLVNLQGCAWRALPCNEAVSRTIQLPSDMDVFEFNAESGDRILISAKATTGELSPLIALYPPDGSRLEAVAYNGLLDHQVRQTGTYRVVIYDGDTGAQDVSLDDMGDYTVTYVGPCSATLIGEGLHLLIDASKDGGAWWFPQSDGFSPDDPHQGQALADYLRTLGFTVTELARGEIITSELLAAHDIVIRANAFAEYTVDEVRAYQDYVYTGGNLLLLGDYLRPNEQDPLALTFGILFQGMTRGENSVDTFVPHPITERIVEFNHYNVGSGVVALSPTADMLGFLSEGTYLDLNDNSVQDEHEPVAPCALGRMSFGQGEIVFSGDVNYWEQVPQPLVDNTVNWFVAQGTPVGGTTYGINTTVVDCLNVTTNQTVQIPLDGLSTWDCDGMGLEFESGDELQIVISGTAH